MIAGASAEEMAAAMALYPLLAPAMARMRTEGAKLDGTAILTTMTFESVKSADQIAAEEKARAGDKPSASGGVGGLVGGLARRAAQKKTDGDPKPRAMVMTSKTRFFELINERSVASAAQNHDDHPKLAPSQIWT